MSKIFTTQEFVSNLAQNKPDEKKAHSILKNRMEKFDIKVYRNGLRNAINRCMIKGMSGKFNNVNFYVYTIANKILVTFTTSQENQLSFVGDLKDTTNWGLQVIESDLENAIQMIDVVSNNWDATKIKPDSCIAII